MIAIGKSTMAEEYDYRWALMKATSAATSCGLAFRPRLATAPDITPALKLLTICASGSVIDRAR